VVERLVSPELAFQFGFWLNLIVKVFVKPKCLMTDHRAVLTLNRYNFIRLRRLQPNYAGIIVCTNDSDRNRLARANSSSNLHRSILVWKAHLCCAPFYWIAILERMARPQQLDYPVCSNLVRSHQICFYQAKQIIPLMKLFSLVRSR